jgi:release factor glutamine methyltransferase
VALAHERPRATVLATDVSADALEVARRNAVRLGVGGRVRFARADLFDDIDERFDLIVANPPYVPQHHRVGLQPEVRDYEPAVAIFARDDGLSIIQGLVAQAAAHLVPGGVLLFEFGFGQDADVERLIADAPDLAMTGLKRDLQGIARTAIVTRTRSGHR